MTRMCGTCSADISARHYHAKFCFSCLSKVEKEKGARAAYSKVSTAIKHGVLAHPTMCLCADCGKTARDYDHRDYSKPLDVQPVCRSCNKLRGPAKRHSAIQSA